MELKSLWHFKFHYPIYAIFNLSSFFFWITKPWARSIVVYSLVHLLYFLGIFAPNVQLYFFYFFFFLYNSILPAINSSNVCIRFIRVINVSISKLWYADNNLQKILTRHKRWGFTNFMMASCRSLYIYYSVCYYSSVDTLTTFLLPKITKFFALSKVAVSLWPGYGILIMTIVGIKE